MPATTAGYCASCGCSVTTSAMLSRSSTADPSASIWTGTTSASRGARKTAVRHASTTPSTLPPVRWAYADPYPAASSRGRHHAAYSGASTSCSDAIAGPSRSTSASSRSRRCSHLSAHRGVLGGSVPDECTNDVASVLYVSAVSLSPPKDGGAAHGALRFEFHRRLRPGPGGRLFPRPPPPPRPREARPPRRAKDAMLARKAAEFLSRGSM